MKSGPGVLAAIAIFTFYNTEVSAQDRQTSISATRHLCAEKDLSGTYVLKDFKETPPGSESRWRSHFSHEYLIFYGKGRLYNSAATNKELHSPAETGKFLGPQTPLKKYTLSADGVLDLYSNNKIVYSYRCITSLADADGYKRGDIILTGYSQKGRNELYKLYRHWY